MKEYSTFCSELQLHHCKICNERWPQSGVQKHDICKRCTKNPNKFSFKNEQVPSVIPPELQNLTMIEKLLIARATPLMKVYVRPGGQKAYKGHCINISQNIDKIANILPNLPSSISLVTLKKKGTYGISSDLTVRRFKIQSALLWL